MAAATGNTFDTIVNNLKNKIYSPIYLLQGDEPYFIDVITDLIEKGVLDENEREFNLSIFYGKESEVGNIIDAAKSFPMMASYQVIIVKEAQSLKNIEQLEAYCKQPQPTTILVLCHKYKTVDKRKALYKAVSKHVCFESKTLYDNQIPRWITDYLTSKKYSITPQAVNLIAECIGNDLTKIANELGKLVINVPPSQKITEKEVEENVGILKDYNTFEYVKSLITRDILKANKIVNHFISNPKEFPLVLIIGLTFNYFLKLVIIHKLTPQERANNNTVAAAIGVNPFIVPEYQTAARNYNLMKVVRIISILREYDLKAKGIDSSLPYSEILKEMTFKILHA